MMAKSFDLLIEFLLDEIAICGENGKSTARLCVFANTRCLSYSWNIRMLQHIVLQYEQSSFVLVLLASVFGDGNKQA
jgi:hypothetical protein